MVKDIKKIAEVVNTMIMEMERSILMVSINNWTTNATNILRISEDLWYLIQSDIKDRIFQIQRMLANKLNRYKGRENFYMDENIQKIQELYMNEEQQKKKEGKVEDKEVILIKLYKVSESTSLTKSSSFINKKINNLLKYMKFIKSSTQTRIFQPPPYYQSLWSRGEQDPNFWKEITTALINNKHNTETLRNKYPINMFQGGPPHKPFFIAIDNWEQVIIGPNKKIVATYVVGELEVLVWFMGTWMLKMGYCYNWYLKNATWRRVKGNDNTIGCTKVVSVSASYSRCSNLTFSSCSITYFPHGLYSDFSWPIYIYSIDTILYPYALPLSYISYLFSSLCLSITWAHS